jgi:hypothetical protein
MHVSTKQEEEMTEQKQIEIREEWDAFGIPMYQRHWQMGVPNSEALCAVGLAQAEACDVPMAIMQRVTRIKAGGACQIPILNKHTQKWEAWRGEYRVIAIEGASKEIIGKFDQHQQLEIPYSRCYFQPKPPSQRRKAMKKYRVDIREGNRAVGPHLPRKQDGTRTQRFRKLLERALYEN